MKSLTFFLRNAIAQFTTLLNVLIRALQIQRRAQLIAVLVVSVVIGFLVARTVHSTRASQLGFFSCRAPDPCIAARSPFDVGVQFRL
jgi:hypothetical protein